ncbi:MAG: response regulator [Lachnospiraceae bacterium]
MNNYQNISKSYLESNHLKSPEIVSFTSGEALLSDKGEKGGASLLDIEMPGMNGIYVGNELKQSNKNVIVFVATSYSEYLDEAMRFHVFRYLSKPLDKQRFFAKSERCLSLLQFYYT